MSKLGLSAGVQYNDYIGGIALDSADLVDLNSFLKDQGIAVQEEYVIGFESFIHPEKLGEPFVIDVTVHLENISTEAIREVSVGIEFIKFIKLFKRINFVAEKMKR